MFGEFLGKLGQDSSVSKSNCLQVDICQLFLIESGYRYYKFL